MLLFKIFLTLTILSSVFECGSGAASRTNSGPVNATPIAAATPFSISKDLLITLERGPCFGRCPQYTVTISADGKIEFEGKTNTKVIGKASGKISENDLKELVTAFEKINYFDLKERYTDDACPEVATDMSSATTSFQSNGKQKTVFHYHGCVTKDTHESYPPGLNLLENKIDDIA
ncbi:MAG: DUF6438 domain-containing protein, partial [Acidobacteriota bacterium]